MGCFGGLWGFFWGWGGSQTASGPPDPQDPPGKKWGGHNPMESMGRTASIRDIRESPHDNGDLGGGRGGGGGLRVFFLGGGLSPGGAKT